MHSCAGNANRYSSPSSASAAFNQDCTATFRGSMVRRQPVALQSVQPSADHPDVRSTYTRGFVWLQNPTARQSRGLPGRDPEIVRALLDDAYWLPRAVG